jgi:probable rRNA maturation factor
MTYTIDIQSTGRHKMAIDRALAEAARETLAHEAVDAGASLTILLTDDAYLQQLNRQYRGMDQPTDVLSFPVGEDMPHIAELAHYLGDIAISVEYAQRQAATKGHELIAELKLLVIHGVLHLLGYDHADADEKAAMWASQEVILRKLGLARIQPTEDDSDGEH